MFDDEDYSFDDSTNREIDLSDDVYDALASILPSDDPADQKDFDEVSYINELFPSEQSLSNIDEVITQVKSKIKYLKCFDQLV